MPDLLDEDEFSEIGIDRDEDSVVFSGSLQQRTVTRVGPKLP